MQTATQTFMVTVPSAVQITSGPIPAVSPNGSTISHQMTASGGVAPYTWSVSSGAMPHGWNLDTASGLISGTTVFPAGDFSFGVTVTDAS